MVKLDYIQSGRKYYNRQNRSDSCIAC